VKSDIEIALEANKRPIFDVAAELGLEESEVVPYGRYIAKVPLTVLERLADKPNGKLVLVSAITPTSMGEGKTTTAIGLGQALCRIGHRAAVAIREPSLGPCMGLKGGAAGGGYSQVLPMEEINLHFTGDLHAISTAHNLLSALVDNHLHQRLAPELHPRRVVWRRTLDMNDRSLRHILVGLQGAGVNGVMREDGFDITAASEVMAILCLSRGIADLKARLGNIIVGYDHLSRPVLAREIGAAGAMAALLKNAIMPNLVQTTEGTPALVHGGPFANIAHGCNSVLATRLAQKLADFVVTEAGFGADLGAEKFMHIKCRSAGLAPSAVVLVVTRRAHAVHGIDNVLKHAENIRLFGLPVVVSLNRFAGDSDSELAELERQCNSAGLEAIVTDFRERGGAGGEELAARVAALAGDTPSLTFQYDLEAPLADKVRTIASRLYGAADVEFSSEARRDLANIEKLGYGKLPVCIAKTPASLTDDPKIPGRPRGFSIHVSSARISAGAGFVVVYTGNVMTMPGLPKQPAALAIDVADDGTISGLF
jgi:formate--tetrahydrofolate ligase